MLHLLLIIYLCIAGLALLAMLKMLLSSGIWSWWDIPAILLIALVWPLIFGQSLGMRWHK